MLPQNKRVSQAFTKFCIWFLQLSYIRQLHLKLHELYISDIQLGFIFLYITT
jgi:hypothetical protein